MQPTCRMTRAGLNETSTSLDPCFRAGVQLRMLCTSFSRMWKLSQLRTADSKSTRMEKGSWSVSELDFYFPITYNTQQYYLFKETDSEHLSGNNFLRRLFFN